MDPSAAISMGSPMSCDCTSMRLWHPDIPKNKLSGLTCFDPLSSLHPCSANLQRNTGLARGRTGDDEACLVTGVLHCHQCLRLGLTFLGAARINNSDRHQLVSSQCPGLVKEAMGDLSSHGDAERLCAENLCLGDVIPGRFQNSHSVRNQRNDEGGKARDERNGDERRSEES